MSRGLALRIVALALAFRVLSALVGFVANSVFPRHQPEAFRVYREAHPFWDAFARHDSGWYYGIARSGYRYVEGGRSNVAFFPLYPMAMRLGARALGARQHHYYFAGVAISWAAFAAAMVLLYRLARLDVGDDAARRAVLYCAVFPFSFFYGVVYTESLFLLLTLAAFHGVRTRRFLAGGLASGLATATRVNGVMALPALAVEAWKAARGSRAEHLRAALGLVLAGSGIAAYSAYVYVLSGNPLEWKATIERWEYYPGGSFWTGPLALLGRLATRPLSYLAEKGAPYDALNGLTGIAVAMAIPFVWRRLGTGYGLYMAANLWLPLSSGLHEGLGRYCSVLFPLFIWLGTFRSPLLQAGILVASGMLYALGFSLFVTLHPLY